MSPEMPLTCESMIAIFVGVDGVEVVFVVVDIGFLLLPRMLLGV
jgi:hypothetical protein